MKSLIDELITMCYLKEFHGGVVQGLAQGLLGCARVVQGSCEIFYSWEIFEIKLSN